MVLRKLLLVTWGCLWGAGRGDHFFKDYSFRDRVSPHGHHDLQDHTQYQTPLSDDLESEYVRTYFLSYRWPDKIVPVDFDNSFSSEFRPLVYQAMDALNDLTCVRFRNVSRTKEYHLRVSAREDGCFAQLGYTQGLGAFNKMNLDYGCHSVGIALHEMFHALGISHHHQRPDRDYYVTILKDNIIVGMLSNFLPKTEEGAYLWTMGLPYDYNSIMHYPLHAFNLDEKHTPTMKLKKPFSGFLGNRECPSRTDIAMINRYYECWDHYLGDDIPDAVPYEEFHSRYIKKKPHKTGEVITHPVKPASEALTKWLRFRKSLNPQ
ncbi:astacin-like metalloprotease toxin 3 [Procambarus clarkii]|uniref:astacin-like metalloprotease toxin 3 n=1 Tax=Procambarus clarkii TaxID=6728 RepID=UPI003743BF55